ncbi:hypothetical protein JD844_012165 [Phrynosoma platyrhinos]|uniref:Uncharacterized protein n=1 Tax=Phrynosoma platyrhinos TaxID=52577 RepID=A0ABQ7TK01_PHRPL|nr:hypothetical protein JD844_012165 [Phrynosoma platyrhinos]
MVDSQGKREEHADRPGLWLCDSERVCLQNMEKEENVEAKVFQHEKNCTAKMYCKLLRKKNGISPWKETEKIKNKLEANENDQHTFEGRNEGSEFLDTQEASQALSPSREDNAEEFNSELTFFNDLVITSDPVSHIEYVPYYRTYTSFIEIPLCINPDGQQENTEKEDELQSNGCAWKLQYEDEPLYDFDHFPTGYFPYYRTCEEYFSNSELPSDLYNTAEIEETETNSADPTDSETDCEIVGVCEDIVSYKQSSKSYWS